MAMQPSETTEPPLDPTPVLGSGEPSPRGRHSLRETLSTVLLLLLAPLIAVGLTLYVFQSYQVDGPSMEQTLQNNDRLIVWKLPRTWAKITGHQYIPNRGDVIILNESGLSEFGASTEQRQLVKRVIGLPGDRVVIKDNVVTIYNAQYPNGFEPDATLPYGADGKIPPTANSVDTELADDELYVCGDNRTNSLDSRSFGPIKTDQVVGKLVLRMMPLSNIKKFCPTCTETS